MKIWKRHVNQILHQILHQNTSNILNINSIFQGCQILYVRVAISQKANKIDFQHVHKIIVYKITYNTMILLVLVDFLYLNDMWAEVCSRSKVDFLSFLVQQLPQNGKEVALESRLMVLERQREDLTEQKRFLAARLEHGRLCQVRTASAKSKFK